MTVASADPASSPVARPPRPPLPSWALLSAAALLAAAAGYATGRHASHASVAVHHGLAQITPVQIGVNAEGVSYSIPLDVSWKDASGGWHEGERPSCLPATATSRPVTFGAVRFDLNGVGGHAVVWVDCSRS